MKYKQYKDYDDYVKSQSSKIDNVVKQFGERWGARAQEILIMDRAKYMLEFKPLMEFIKKGDRVLCLGARQGIEVIAFKDFGFINSIGIDLNPSQSLEPGLVINGDFHNLDFKDKEFDNVYTNALDHCLDITKVISEMTRVIKDDGTIILRCEFHNNLDGYESCIWNSTAEIIDIIKNLNFEVIYNKKTDGWVGNYTTLIAKKKN